jgi:hypothetical protein
MKYHQKTDRKKAEILKQKKEKRLREHANAINYRLASF